MWKAIGKGKQNKGHAARSGNVQRINGSGLLGLPMGFGVLAENSQSG
jgi:hypothetical protein